jgi:N-acetyl-1-D-myo-inositol-2-amino-2-deoxy-alpha-D-glucopyranoside deacetylase
VHGPYAERRVLGLFPHPDDEAYAAGGTLALCARGGAAVTIACATRGESGRDRTDRNRAADALGALRARELDTSCRLLGAGAPVILGLPDGGLAATDRAAAATLVRNVVARVRPHVVITLGRDGVYGAIDHRAWTGIVTAALAPWSPAVRVLHAAFPRGLFDSLYRALRRAGGTPAVVDPEAATLGADPGQVHLRITIDAVRDRKVAAVAAHRSQLRGGDPRSFLRPGLLDALLSEEWFIADAGPPVPPGAADVFAGL